MPILRDLIGFDTTSRNSNLALIDDVREYLILWMSSCYAIAPLRRFGSARAR